MTTSGRGLRAFIPIWFGQTASALGSGLIGFALAVRVFQETGSVTRYAFLGLSIALPGLLAVPLAGYVADHFDRRRVIVLANLAAAANNLLLWFLITRGFLEAWFIYPVVMVSATCGVFGGSAMQAAVTLLVGKEHYGRVSGMVQMRTSVVQILSPILAAMLLDVIDIEGIVLINLVSYLFPPLVLAFLPLPRPKESEAGRAAAGGGVWRQVRFGWTFIRERPGLFRLLILLAVANFAFATVGALMTPLILGFSTPVMLGLVSSIAAAGALVGGILMSVWAGPRDRVRMSLFALLAAGILLQLGGLRPSVTLIASAAFFYMFSFPIVNAVSAALWRAKVPADVQGRVFAVRRLIAGWSAPVSLALAGPLADRFFEPAMLPGGALAGTFGKLMGVGPGRGIGLMLIVMGLIVIANVVAGFFSTPLRRLEEDVPDAIEDTEAPEDRDEPRRRPDTIGRPGLVPGLATALLLAAAGALALASLRPPPVPPESETPPSEFSTERAARHLDQIAREPHPVGSPAQARVRDLLVAELRGLGLETEVQRATPVERLRSLFQLVTVENVVARLPGTANRRGSVLLVAHYDSVPNGPGASDNGAAVAALLETARALTASEPLPSDVVFLFTDAEETGLQGARAFVDEHPLAADAAVVLNFDARGHGGAVLMFETGSSNSRWIPHFAAAARRPVASSLLDQIYKRLPNDTDFTVFRDAGYAGFNFAFIEGLTHYHSELDRPGEVRLESLAHQGSYALGLTRRLAALDLSGVEAAPPEADEARDDRTYFSVAGGRLVHYPRRFGYVLAAVAGLAFVALVALALRRGRLAGFGLWQGAMTFLGQLVAVPVAVTLVWMVLRDALSLPMLMSSTPAAALFMIAFSCLVVAAVALLYRLSRHLAGPLELFAGALFWWLVLTVLVSGAALPADANFLLVWPFLGALVAFGYFVLTPAEAQRPWTTALVLVVSALPGILLVVPFTAILYVGLQSLSQLGGLPLVPAVLLAGLLVPHLEIASRGRAWLPAAAALLFLVATGVALTGRSWGGSKEIEARSSAGPIRESSVFYAWDADEGKASWFSFDATPTAWTRQFGLRDGVRAPFQDYYPLFGRKLLHHDAAAAPRPADPELEVAEASENGGRRRYEVLLRPGPGARARLVWFEPAGAVDSVRLAGIDVSLADAENGRVPVLMELPVTSTEEELVFEVGGEVTVVVLEQHDGLPAVPGLAPRPPAELVRPGFAVLRSDVTLVRRSFVLAP